MIVYRLSKKKFSSDLSGIGAKTKGGRWNSAGIPMIYTSGSMALSLLECSIHLETDILPDEYVMLHIEIPPSIKIMKVVQKELPKKWRSFPYSKSTKRIGDDFVSESKAAILSVPSAIVPGEANYLISPFHPEAKKIKIIKREKFDFDERLFIN